MLYIGAVCSNRIEIVKFSQRINFMSVSEFYIICIRKFNLSQLFLMNMHSTSAPKVSIQTMPFFVEM